MRSITIQTLQAALPELLTQLQESGEIVITDQEKPIARLLLAPTPPSPKRRFGSLQGTILSMEGFDDPLEDFEAYQP